MSEVSLSWVPPVNKKMAVACFLVTGWLFIALIAATAMGIVSYGEIKYFHWIISLSIPIWVLLMANPNSQNLSSKDEKRVITAMIVTFAVFVIVAIAAMLQGNI